MGSNHGLWLRAAVGLATLALTACANDDDSLTITKDAATGTGTLDAGHLSTGMDGGTSLLDAALPAPAAQLADLKHLVVIYLENHSFDNLLGSYPGAEGLGSALANIAQVDADGGGVPFVTLPQVDPNVPSTLPNKPFDITKFVPENQLTVDLVHRFYQEQLQINGDKMNQFVTISDAKGLSLGYYPTDSLPLVQKLKSIPEQVTVCDHFFHAAFGGSFLNHFWLVAGATPVFPNAPTANVAVLDANGKLVTDGAITPDGFVVNTSYSVNAPHPATAKPEALVPNQTFPNIGDRLTAKGVDWAWYSGGWNDALAGKPDPLFQFHHQPLAFFANYADGTPARAAHLKDETDFIIAASAGTLPAVSFVKPIGANNEHPGYANMTNGETHTITLIDTLMASPAWKDTAIIITYDENGGFFDHVAPPKTDKWGPGSRVPGIVISPFAKGGIDSTVYDTTAILKLIEERWGTDALNARVSGQASLASHAFKFSK